MFVSTPCQPHHSGQSSLRTLACIAILAGVSSAQAAVPKFVLAVNYTADNVSVFRVQPLTGQLTAVPNSPFAVPGVAPSDIVVSPDGKFVYVGNSDAPLKICSFSLDEETGELIPITNYSIPAPYGAESLTITPNGKFLYATGGEGILGFSISDGTLHLISGSPFDFAIPYIRMAVDPTSTLAYGLVWSQKYQPHYWVQPMQILPDGELSLWPIYAATGNSPFDVTVDGSGRFVYVANWADSTISGFSISPGTGALSELPGSPYSQGISLPNSFAATPNGIAVVVDDQLDESVGSMAINSDGSLTPVGSPQFVPPYPNAVVVDPTNEFAYSANTNSNTVSGYRIDTASGALQPIAGGSYINGSDPSHLAVVAATNPPYCPLNTLDPSVTFCAPQSSSTSPARIVAGSTDFSDPVHSMQISVDGVATFEQSGWGAMDVYAVVPAGSHSVTVSATDAAGKTFQTSRQITVSGSTGTSCTDRGIVPAVTICTPLAGAQTGHSVRVVANSVGILEVSSTEVYVDGIEEYSVTGSLIDTYLDLSSGTHWIEVQSTDASGSTWSASARVTTR